MSPEDDNLAQQARDMYRAAEQARALRREEYVAAFESNDPERIEAMQAELVARNRAVDGDRDWTRTLNTSGSDRNAIAVYADADKRITTKELDRTMTPEQREAVRKHDLANHPAYKAQGERPLRFSEDRDPHRNNGKIKLDHSEDRNQAAPQQRQDQARSLGR